MDGIENKIMPPAGVNGNIFEMTEEERRAMNIEQLPETLKEAVEELEKDRFICDVLGEHISKRYITAKKEEWYQYRSQVSEWEIGEYLYKY